MTNTLEIIIKSVNKAGPGLKDAQADITGFAGQVAQSVKGIGLLMASESLAKMGDAVQRFGKQVVDTAQEYTIQVEEFARATGVSAEEASRLIQVADDQRVSITELQTAVRTYSRQMAEAGIATQFNTEEIARLSDEYVKLAPGTERNAFLLDNFGRSGLSMARMLEQGSTAIREMSAAVDENLILTQEAIDAQREYEMAMDDLDDALKGVKIELGRALLEVLPDIIYFIKDVALPILRELVDIFIEFPKPLQLAIVALGGLVVVAGQMGPSLIGLAGILNVLSGAGGLAGVATAAGGAASGLGAAAGAALAAAAPIALLAAAIGLLIYTIITMGPQAWQSLTGILDLLGILGAELFKRISEGINKALKAFVDFWHRIGETARRIAASVLDWFRSVGDAIVRGIWEGLQRGWTWLVEQVQALAHSLLDAAMSALQSGSPARVFIPVGESIPEGIAEGIQRRWPKLIHDFSSMLGDLTFPANSGFAFARAGGGGGGINIDVRRIELHGSLSASERAWMKRNQRDVAEKVLLEALSRG